MNKVFKKYKINPQLLGDFGEFIYRKYAESQNFQVKQTNVAETDVELLKDNKKYLVDVKSSWTKEGGFKGRRSRDDVSSDQVSIKDNSIKIYPDKSSPLFSEKQIIILDVDRYFIEWKTKKTNKNKNENSYQKYRKELKKKIKDFFKKEKNVNIRVVIRGSVSLTRWSAKPDNLPGSKKIIDSYPATIFIQLKYKNNREEEISNIFYIDHGKLGHQIKLIDADMRQQKKGIKKVIDFEHFKKENKKYIFNSIDNLFLKLDSFLS